MWWTICAILIAYWYSRKPTKRGINNIDIITVSNSPDIQPTVKKAVTISYTSDQLRSIDHEIKLEGRRNIPKFETIRKVKSLRINKKRIRLSKYLRNERRKINLNNLSQLGKDPELPDLSSKQIKIGTVNTRSLKGKSQLVMEMLVKENIDLLFVTESWLKNKEEDKIWLRSQEFSKDPWQSENIPRRGQKRGGGIMLITKKYIKKQLIKIIKHEKFEAAIWKLSICSKELIVLGVYHPPEPTGNNMIFIDKLADEVVDLQSRYKNIIMLGDLNIHVNDLGDNDAIYLLDAMLSLGFTQEVKSATHRLGNTLDLIFISQFSSIKFNKVMVTDMLSDHRFVVAELNIGKPKPVCKDIQVRKVTDTAIRQIGEHFEDTSIINASSINEAVHAYEKESERLMDKYCPMKKIKVVNKTRVPWFDDNAKTQRKIVRNRERCWLKYGENHQWTAYKRERTRYVNIIRHNKTQIYSGKVLKAKGNIKELYQIVYGLCGDVTEQIYPKANSDADLANDFAEFFLNKIVTIRTKFEKVPVFEPKEKSIPLLSKFAPLTTKQVSNLVMSMKTKSCELDTLPTKILKEILPNCISALTKLINLSLESVFAENWKIAIVRPLIKKIGLDLIYKNFRPVSNLSFISKLVEKAALCQFLDHCKEYDLIPDYQSAYRENYSCETAVVKFVNDILWGMENQKVTACLFMDLSAAFDTVDHDLLLNILEKQYGISDTALHWYDSYLRPRSFKVCINQNYSKAIPLEFSVPQGSASGANLFTAYCATINDIIPKETTLQGFADDHFIYRLITPRKDEYEVLSDLESTMTKVKIWMDQMKLKLNTDKTEFIEFGSKQQISKCSISTFNAGNDIINRNCSVRCLGAFLDSALTMETHIKTKTQLAMTNLIKIKNIRNFLTREACTTLMVGLVLSHMDYCNSILIGVTSTRIKSLQRIQSMAAKIILLRDKYSSTKNALRELHWLPICERIKYKILTLMFKITHGQAPVYLTNLVTLRPQSTRNLRSNTDQLIYIVPHVKYKTFAFRSFSVQGPLLWNRLPHELRTITSFEHFKNSLKTWLMSQL